MAIRQCTRHHFYDDEKYKVCPICLSLSSQNHENEDRTVAYTTPLDNVADKTIGYQALKDDVVAKPTVGWVVCVKGKNCGRDWRLHEGRNDIGTAVNKESAKSILKHNGNQAAMIGMEILYTIISTLTVTSMMAAFSAAAVRIYGTTLVSLVVSFINDLSRVSRWGYYSPSMIFSPFKFILMALIFVLLVAATGIVTEMLKAPFEVARYRYYLYLRKNGTRTSASSIFESFDFFVQFAIVTGTREIVIQWLPIVIAVATVILTFVFLLSGVIWLAVLILMVGMIAAAVISIYRRLQLWPMAWVQADHPQLSAQQVIARCKEMTAGHIDGVPAFSHYRPSLSR